MCQMRMTVLRLLMSQQMIISWLVIRAYQALVVFIPTYHLKPQMCDTEDSPSLLRKCIITCDSNRLSNSAAYL